MHFAEKPGGEFWLLAMPDKTKRIANRYVVSLDIGGRTHRADWSVISVIDRYHLMNGGVEECIGTWRFHCDVDIALWRAVQAARFFNDAMLVWEVNSLARLNNVEGNHSLTLTESIKNAYPNLYFRDDPQKIREGVPIRYGFFTGSGAGHGSKTDLVTQMNKRLRDMLHIERDRRALDEARYYELKPDGAWGAMENHHDDIYMSRAIGLKVSSIMPPPAETPDYGLRTADADRVRTVADF
jgi:hypothetical protein